MELALIPIEDSNETAKQKILIGDEAPTAAPEAEAPVIRPEAKAPSAPPKVEAPTAPPAAQSPNAPPEAEAPVIPPAAQAPSAPPKVETPAAPPAAQSPNAPPQVEAPTAPAAAQAQAQAQAPNAPPKVEAPVAPAAAQTANAPPKAETPTAPPEAQSPAAQPKIEMSSMPLKGKAPHAPPKIEMPKPQPKVEAPAAAGGGDSSNKAKAREIPNKTVPPDNAHKAAPPSHAEKPGPQLGFAEQLKLITEKIREAHSIREIMLDLVDDICSLFNADRFTIYLITEDKAALVTKIKTGVNSFKDMRLPISEQSIAGYVALHKEMLNIRDVYDEKELASHSAHLRFLQDVDKRTNYRTRQVLVAPIVNADKKELIGVIQIINNKANQPFTESVAKGAEKLADVLAVALSDRHREIAATRYGMLVWDGLISATNLEHVMSLAQAQGGGIEDILIDEYQITPAAIDQALSAFFCVPYQSFSEDMSRPDELLKSLKRGYLEASQWIPVEETPDGTIVILTTDPERIQVSRLVGAIFPKRKLTYRVCSQREFDDTLNLFYGEAIEAGSVDELLGALNTEAEENEAEINLANSEELNAAADNELVKLVNKVIMDAYNMGASDIHVEPMPGRKDKTGIRLRKDGSLMKYIEIPAASRNALVTRLKVMCDLDISEKRIPQDGKIKFKKFAPLDIELRVATLPTQGDVEDVVMRILASGDPIPLEKMAFSERNLQLIKQTIVKPYGLFFVCGPTGSGKTTTLHSILKYINTPDTKIWTAEDPVEITQKGLRQVQVNKKAGLDFATVMRSFLRADPDVIMVGEMRDKETVSTGIEASLTGHLVFATLHTNSAPESIVRLLDMGMDPFNFADALLGILAQRLAKRLCKDCCEPHVASPEEVNSLLQEYAEELKHTERWMKDPQGAMDALRAEWVKRFANEKGEFTLYSKVGCDKCVDTGYRGRVALHELVIGSDPIKKAIQEHARVADLFAIALDEDMRTLKQDGIEKVLQGITDVHQVRAVCIK